MGERDLPRDGPVDERMESRRGVRAGKYGDGWS